MTGPPRATPFTDQTRVPLRPWTLNLSDCPGARSASEGVITGGLLLFKAQPVMRVTAGRRKRKKIEQVSLSLVPTFLFFKIMPLAGTSALRREI